MNYNKALSPAVIGEYLSFDHCSRYFKHRINNITETENHHANEFAEAFNPLDILLSQTGEEFEQNIHNNLVSHAKEVIDLSTDADDITPDHDKLINIIREYNKTTQKQDLTVIYQPTLAGEMKGWDIAGHADFLFIWNRGNDQIEIRVIDAKSAKEQQSYHQIQSALYAKLLTKAIKQHPTEIRNDIKITGGVIARDSNYTPPTPDTVPSFDYETRITDILRLLDTDKELDRVNSVNLQNADHQLDSVCSGCAYNEACSTEAYEQQHVRLLGLTTGEQKILESVGITSIDELADLCTEPREWEWDPTEQKKAGFADDTYTSIKATPGIGEKLPNLVYRAQAIKKQLSDSDEEGSFPAAWIPGTGSCDLPDDTPPTEFEFPYQRGSMIRVYLNVQHDHLRDKLVQLSARISTTKSDINAQRISCVTDKAPSDPTQARETEKELIEEFTSKLYNKIEKINQGMEIKETDQHHPLIHIYTYTETESDALFEACNNHSSDIINSLQSLLEGYPGKDMQRISHLKPEIKEHICIPSPSYGLMHAYDELQPPTDEYNKSRSKEEWCYEPSYSNAIDNVNLRNVFNRRLFNITVDWENKAGNITISPTEHTQLDGLKTRFRYGAEIPLGYHWAAAGRIDSKWTNDIDIDEQSGVVKYEINSYLYHNAKKENQRVQTEDIEAVGKHICDVIEHVERSLIYKSHKVCANKNPIDTSKLPVDSHTTPTIGEAAQEYLWIEHTTQQHEKYESYRKMPSQRILSGESLPVQIIDIDEDTENNLTVEVTGKLRYDEIFGDHAQKAKLVCKQKGNEGTSSGDWMTANPFDPGRTDNTLSDPYELEAGINASIININMKKETVTFELRNSYWEPGKFDSFHRNYTTKKHKARENEKYTHIQQGGWIILDPLTDNLTADRANKALKTIDTNNTHELLESLRWGDNTLTETDFSKSELCSFSQWIEQNIEPKSYPNKRQEEYITTSDQIALLQGPPGTGKTTGTLAPSLLGRIYAAEQTGKSVNGLITAPSNTAIDELASATAELLDAIESKEDAPLSKENIEIIRLTNTTPETPTKSITYADYNIDEDEPYLRKIRNRLTETSEDLCEAKQDANNGNDSETNKQQTFGDFGSDTESDLQNKQSNTEAKHTLVFATPTKSWGLLDHFSADDADVEEIANQNHWNLLAVDEASMLTLPKLLLAGVGVKREGQYMISGDHRQLPPVQKHEWNSVFRRSILETAPQLSSLDYFRLLSGNEDVLEERYADSYEHNITPSENPIPIVRLNETYRFGPDTAEFIKSAVYSEDGIDYTSNRSSDDINLRHTATTPPLQTVYGDGEITLITYTTEKSYQQVNLLEAIISQAILQNKHPNDSAGLVTPHNAQRSRLREMLRSMSNGGDSGVDLDENTFVETVERFQGGEQDLMVVSATATDPQYIKAENEFLLEKNRANVSFTRHKEKLIVIAAESVLSHIPSDPDIYNEAALWKMLSGLTGEAPTDNTKPQWKGSLSEFTAPQNPPPSLNPDQIKLNIYTNN